MEKLPLSEPEEWLLLLTSKHYSVAHRLWMSEKVWGQPDEQEPYVCEIIGRMGFGDFVQCVSNLGGYDLLDVENLAGSIQYYLTGDGLQYCRYLEDPPVDIAAESLVITREAAEAAKRSATAAEKHVITARKATSAARVSAIAACVSIVVACLGITFGLLADSRSNVLRMEVNGLRNQVESLREHYMDDGETLELKLERAHRKMENAKQAGLGNVLADPK